MARRLTLLKFLPLLGVLALSHGLGGCQAADQVAFTNNTDTWLNVRFYVAEPEVTMNDSGWHEQPHHHTWQFVSNGRLQVKPGETAAWSWSNPNQPNPSWSSSPLVHVHIEPVTPSWHNNAQGYWLELLTPPPMHIVAAGRFEKMRFDTGEGAVALIPTQELNTSRYEHKVLSTVESEPTP